MSVQDRIEVAGASAADDAVAPEQPTASVVVRRRAGLPAVIAASALGLAAAYLWRGLQDGGVLAWLVAVVLAAIAAAHLALLVGARTPLLVADATGVRARRGRRWRGLPWSGIDAVEVAPQPSRWREGRVAIAPVGSGDAVAVPLSWATAVSTDDIGAALRSLAQGRTDVAVAERATAPAREPDGTPTAQPEPEPGPEPDGTPAGQPEPDGTPPPAPDEPEPAVEPGPTATKTRRPALSVLRAIRPALRAEVTKPGTARRQTTVGSLALSEPVDDPPVVLPEIAHLRRSRPGNVSLLVPAPQTDEADQTPAEPVLPVPVGNDVEQPQPVVGPQLAAARQRLGLSVDDLAVRTRIRAHVIESIEVDNFAPCGGDFYARGHLRALARVLGVDAEPLVREYDKRYAAAPINPRTVFEADRATGARGTIRMASGGPNWGALIAVVLALLLMWGVARLFTDGAAGRTDQPAVSGFAAVLDSPGVIG